MVLDAFKAHPWMLIACLFLAALVLFPATATESKYVWEETIPVKVIITYGSQGIT